MEFILIGTAVGLVMGITGAGGALLSIPLFVNLLNFELKAATVISLVVVCIGAVLNLLFSKERSDKSLAIFLLVFASIANWLLVPLKTQTPDIVVALLLAAVAIYSLWGVWRKRKVSTAKATGEKSFVKIILVGLLLGCLTTLTGLGGGVLLVPVLMSVFGNSFKEAVPTSLLAIFLISSSSLYFQWSTFASEIQWSEVLLLGLGILSSALGLKFSLDKIPATGLESLRKVLFSLVAFYSISSMIWKALGQG